MKKLFLVLFLLFLSGCSNYGVEEVNLISSSGINISSTYDNNNLTITITNTYVDDIEAIKNETCISNSSYSWC